MLVLLSGLLIAFQIGRPAAPATGRIVGGAKESTWRRVLIIVAMGIWALLLPSVELKAGGPAYAWALKPLLDARELPSLIVLLGCDHGAADPTLTFTRKHYQTPLGALATDIELVDQVIADATAISTELGELSLIHISKPTRPY